MSKEIKLLSDNLYNWSDTNLEGDITRNDCDKIIQWMLCKLPQADVSSSADLGNCLEKNCNEKATKDYNGHQHYVCDYHYRRLNDYFDEEYR